MQMLFGNVKLMIFLNRAKIRKLSKEENKLVLKF